MSAIQPSHPVVPPPWLGRLRRRAFGVSESEVDFGVRGFPGRLSSTRSHLERVGAAFVSGYNAALEEDQLEHLALRLEREVPEVRVGFAFEGAAMGLAVRDTLAPWGRRLFPELVADVGRRHVYMLHVGFGWAVARLRRSPVRAFERLDPLLRWLAVDGYGFHQGFFDWRRYVAEARPPRGFEGYGRRAFDQGLGRALWFVEGARPAAIVETVSRFEPGRRGDLWAGLGLASAYAGGGEGRVVAALATAAGERHAAELAQGAAFAAKARLRAGNLVPHTERACQLLCGVGAVEAAAWTDAALVEIGASEGTPEVPDYERWRRAIQARYTTSNWERSIPCQA